MLALFRVGIFEAGGSVEPVKAVLVLWEMGRRPIQYNADAVFMHHVNKLHKIVGGSVAGGWGKISGCLIPPGAVEGIFGYGHNFNMGIAHILNVDRKLFPKLFIGQGVAVGKAAPGAKVNFIYINGGRINVPALFFCLPFAILPLLSAKVINLGSVGGGGFAMKRKGIGF